MWLTFLLAFVVVVISITVFVWLGTPVYRLEKNNVKALLLLLLEDEATQSDWDVFAGLPIRHNPELDKIRLRCCDIVEKDGRFSGGKLHLTENGRSEVKALLDELPDN